MANLALTWPGNTGEWLKISSKMNKTPTFFIEIKFFFIVSK